MNKHERWRIVRDKKLDTAYEDKREIRKLQKEHEISAFHADGLIAMLEAEIADVKHSGIKAQKEGKPQPKE